MEISRTRRTRPRTAVVLGIGHWHAPWHVAALQAEGLAVGLWDPDARVASAHAARLGLPAFDSLDAALDSRPDVAVVAVRPSLAPHVLRATIDAGVPLLTEKPCGTDAAAVGELSEHADRAGAFAAVLFVNRLSPVWTTWPADDPVITASFRINNGPPQRYLDAGVGWVLDAAEGGGCLRNLGIHAADAVADLAARSGADVAEIEVLSACASYTDGVAVETHLTATVRSAQGWAAVIEAGYNLPDPAGSDSVWRLSTRQRCLLDDMSGLTVITPEGTTRRPAPTSAERYRSIVSLCLDRIASGDPPPASLSDCHRAAGLVDRIYAALPPSQRVDMS